MKSLPSVLDVKTNGIYHTVSTGKRARERLFVAMIITESKLFPLGDTALDEAQPNPLRFQHNILLTLLLALVVAAWAVLASHDHATTDMTIASAPVALRALLSLSISVVMMVAMMLPTAVPRILAFHRTQAGKRHLGEAFISTWVVATYLVVWSVFAFYAGVLVEAPVVRTAVSTAEVGGTMLIIAGLYQLTTLKEFCLSKCRTPIDFVVTSRDGIAGTFFMGLLHGAYCLGCCWMLFLIPFPLGMSVGAMAAVTLIILAEKTLPWPLIVRYSTGFVLVLYGALVITSPQLLPTLHNDGNSAVPAETPMKMPQRLP